VSKWVSKPHIGCHGNDRGWETVLYEVSTDGKGTIFIIQTTCGLCDVLCEAEETDDQ